MTVKEFITKLKAPYLWWNFAAMALVVLAIVLGSVVGMSYYTHHNEEIVVPDLRQHSLQNAVKAMEALELEVVVSDTGYVKSLAPGCVLEQVPAPGAKVKSGRVVYVTINALDTPMLTLPDVIDNSSYRQAVAKLKSMGFKVGEPKYIHGEKDWVYGIKSRGRSLQTGDRVSVEDILIIQVGSGVRDNDDPELYFTDPEVSSHEEFEMEVGDIDEFEEI